MAKELEALLKDLEALGDNYTNNLRAVLGESEERKLVDIYAAGLGSGLAGLNEALTARYGALSKKDREACDRTVERSGAGAMLAAANAILAGDPFDAKWILVFASELFPKIFRFLRGILSIEEDEEVDNMLRFIEDVIYNVIKFLSEGALRHPDRLPPAPDED